MKLFSTYLIIEPLIIPYFDRKFICTKFLIPFRTDL